MSGKVGVKIGEDLSSQSCDWSNDVYENLENGNNVDFDSTVYEELGWTPVKSRWGKHPQREIPMRYIFWNGHYGPWEKEVY